MAFFTFEDVTDAAPEPPIQLRRVFFTLLAKIITVVSVLLGWNVWGGLCLLVVSIVSYRLPPYSYVPDIGPMTIFFETNKYLWDVNLCSLIYQPVGLYLGYAEQDCTIFWAAHIVCLFLPEGQRRDLTWWLVREKLLYFKWADRIQRNCLNFQRIMLWPFW